MNIFKKDQSKGDVTSKMSFFGPAKKGGSSIISNMLASYDSSIITVNYAKYFLQMFNVSSGEAYRLGLETMNNKTLMEKALSRSQGSITRDGMKNNGNYWNSLLPVAYVNGKNIIQRGSNNGVSLLVPVDGNELMLKNNWDAGIEGSSTSCLRVYVVSSLQGHNLSVNEHIAKATMFEAIIDVMCEHSHMFVAISGKIGSNPKTWDQTAFNLDFSPEKIGFKSDTMSEADYLTFSAEFTPRCFENRSVDMTMDTSFNLDGLEIPNTLTKTIREEEIPF